MDKILRDFTPSEPKGLADYRRNGVERSLPYVQSTIAVDAPIRSSQGMLNKPLSDPPFFTKLGSTGGSYYVTVGEGYVVERLVRNQTGTNQVKFHEPSNLFTAGDPTQFSIDEGEAAYVEYDVNIRGEVSSVPIIVIAADDIAVVRYYPLIGDYAGQAGKFSYKLCSLINESGTIKLKKFLSGDNVTHIIERFSMLNLQNETGDFYKVLKDYDPDTDEVKFRSLEQLGSPGVALISPTASGENVIAFRRAKERETSPQIRVSEDGDAILVEGNGKDGSLVWYDCDDVPTTLLEWEDGLITTEGEVSFKAGCITLTPTDTPP